MKEFGSMADLRKEIKTRIKDDQSNKNIEMQPIQQTPIKVKKPLYKRWWFWIIVFIIAIKMLSNINNSNSSKIIHHLLLKPKIKLVIKSLS